MLAATLFLCKPAALDAKSVIGFAVTGGSSHQAAIARVGNCSLGHTHGACQLTTGKHMPSVHRTLHTLSDNRVACSQAAVSVILSP